MFDIHPDAGTARDAGKPVMIIVRRFARYTKDSDPVAGGQVARHVRATTLFGAPVFLYTKYADLLDALHSGPLDKIPGRRGCAARAQQDQIRAMRKKLRGRASITLVDGKFRLDPVGPTAEYAYTATARRGGEV